MNDKMNNGSTQTVLQHETGGGHQPQPQPQPQEHSAPKAVIWTSEPQRIVCPNCNYPVTTEVTKVPGGGTLVSSAFLCLMCCVTAWIPFYTQACDDSLHECPHCHTVIGEKKFL